MSAALRCGSDFQGEVEQVAVPNGIARGGMERGRSAMAGEAAAIMVQSGAAPTSAFGGGSRRVMPRVKFLLFRDPQDVAIFVDLNGRKLAPGSPYYYLFALRWISSF